MKKIVLKWYPIILAFLGLLYSVGYGIIGVTEEAQYSAHWPDTVLFFLSTIIWRLFGNSYIMRMTLINTTSGYFNKPPNVF